ncbi:MULTISPECIES: DUF397 domain-containing protein [unclassified Streptomyces]|uniref:DUF397 domain-containing protein n=1 Tax=unclassified Streptomyces TaxID=2593676 RepID=UPI002DDC61C1|nr:DUF397 domain-containing protein [Streptomyces sp. NBC_01237]WRZ74447.1 DUF397 domain-containing protein [Streptomyces sp. NBC_01237]
MIRKPPAGAASALEWFKSSYSDSSNPSDCVEVATTPVAVHVRDSKNAHGPRLAVSRAAWTGFVPYAAGH